MRGSLGNMDLWIILLIVAVVVALIVIGLVIARRRQRQGTVLAAPNGSTAPTKGQDR